MNLFDVIILSIIEGITEFLPISSTGHLILATKVLNLPSSEFVKSFEVIIQSGAICAVIVLYGKKLLTDHDLLKKTFVAFLPTALVGLILYKFIKQFLLGNSTVVVISLLVGGIILIGIELFLKQKKSTHEEINTKKLSYQNAFLVGIFQSLSVIPGVSRAAATIIGGILVGMNRTQATEFSFILAIPTMLAATGLDLIQSYSNFSSNDIFYLVIGFTGSFLVALISIKWLLKFVQTHSFISFGVYRIIIAILFFLFN